MNGPRAVALGGGHGLYTTLSALRLITDRVTAVVTVADDGGSSGRLRRELGVLPPGDLRMALSALAGRDDAGALWSTVFQHRFGGSGALAGHAVGNLLLAGLLEVLGDPVAALDEAAALVGAHGRVLPMSTEPLDIEAEVTGLSDDASVTHRIRGQVAVASTPGQVRQVRLRPSAGPLGPGPPVAAGEPAPVRACPQAVAAVLAAEVVILGPGSWFTSVLPHLLVPALLEALLATPARRVVVLNLEPQPGETEGFSPEQHLDVLSAHAPGLRVDAVIADAGAVPVPERLRRAARELGGVAVLAPVADPVAAGRHDPRALARALGDVLAARQAAPGDPAVRQAAPGDPAARQAAPGDPAARQAAPGDPAARQAAPNDSDRAGDPGAGDLGAIGGSRMSEDDARVAGEEREDAAGGGTDAATTREERVRWR